MSDILKSLKIKKSKSQKVKVKKSKSQKVKDKKSRTQELKKVESQEVKKSTNVEVVVLPRYSSQRQLRLGF